MSNLQMMAMRELKLPMLKHSRATSMKNSTTRARCFFFMGCQEDDAKKTKNTLEMESAKRQTKLKSLIMLDLIHQHETHQC